MSRRLEIRLPDSRRSTQSYIFLPTSGCKERIFDSSGLSSEDLDFCVRSTPLREKSDEYRHVCTWLFVVANSLYKRSVEVSGLEEYPKKQRASTTLAKSLAGKGINQEAYSLKMGVGF